MTVQRLRGLDAAFFYLETPSQHMHVTAMMLLDPDTGTGSAATADELPNHEAIAEAITQTLLDRLLQQDAFRKRMVEAPLGIAHPAWVDVARVHPQEHVRSRMLPGPGTLDQLAKVVGEIAGVGLDRSRPLWELWTITGIEGGRIGVVLKVHHAMLDGVSGLGVLGRLFTTEPETTAADRATALTEEPAEPSALRLAGSALLSLLRAPASVVRTLTHTARAVGPFVRNAIEQASAAVPTILPFSAPRSMLNHALTAERAVAFGRVTLTAVKEIKSAYGVTVNDVVLAACTRALGDYLRAHGEPPPGPIVASVPVSEHVAGDTGQPSNRVSAMFVGLPVHLTAVEDILAFIQAQSAGAKGRYESLGSAMLADWAELAPPALFAGAAGLYSRWQLAERLPPPHSIVISNVPGPPFALYVGRVRLAAAYPLGPVLEGAGINISVLSYAGSVDIGLITCPRAVAEPSEIARGFERSVEDMLASARQLVSRRGRLAS
jgi:WS/DGAT/MGAT family acyltransferase